MLPARGAFLVPRDDQRTAYLHTPAGCVGAREQFPTCKSAGRSGFHHALPFCHHGHLGHLLSYVCSRPRICEGLWEKISVQYRWGNVHPYFYVSYKDTSSAKKISSISFPKTHDIFLASSSENFVLPSSFLLYAAFVPKPKSFAMSSHVNPFSLRSSRNRSNILLPPFRRIFLRHLHYIIRFVSCKDTI